MLHQKQTCRFDFFVFLHRIIARAAFFFASAEKRNIVVSCALAAAIGKIASKPRMTTGFMLHLHLRTANIIKFGNGVQVKERRGW